MYHGLIEFLQSKLKIPVWGLLLTFLMIPYFSTAQDLKVYRVHPREPYPGTAITLYGTGFDKENVFLSVDGAYFTKKSPDIISWDAGKISLFLPNSNGRKSIYISDGKKRAYISYSPRKSGKIEYFNPVTYTLSYTVTIKGLRRRNKEKGNLLLYIPQPLISDEVTSKEILELTPEPDYIQDNGILVYSINPDTTNCVVVEQKIKVSTLYKKYHFDSFTDQPAYDTTSSLYRYYTREEKPFIIPNDPVIVKLRRSIVSGKDTPLEKAEKIYKWVTGKMEHEYPPENRSPHYSIEHGKGDCLSDAYLFASLARSAGLPVRFNSGYIFYHTWEIGGQHFWEEVLIPGAGWITFDVSFGHSDDFLSEHEYPAQPSFYSGGTDGRRMAFSKGITSLYKPDAEGKPVFFKNVDHMQIPRLYPANPKGKIYYTLDKKMKILEIEEKYSASQDWFNKNKEAEKSE